MPDTKKRFCITRLIKNEKYLKEIASELLKDKNLCDIISFENLTLLNTISDPATIFKDVKLVNLLKQAMLPPHHALSGRLFSGTIYFVRMVFDTYAGQFSVSSQDMQVAQNYAKRAIRKISRYASQYGYNNVAVSDYILDYQVNLRYGKQYNDNSTDTIDNLKIWVKAIIEQYNLPTSSSCLVFLNPASSGIVNNRAPPSGMWDVGGYHDYSTVPYCFCNVFQQNYTISDAADNYAQVLSHEMAEMVVDPYGRFPNPEVCDVCSVDCGLSWRDFFSNNDQYVGTATDFPPRFEYAYFINAIARPACISSSAKCLLPGYTYHHACAYNPP